MWGFCNCCRINDVCACVWAELGISILQQASVCLTSHPCRLHTDRPDTFSFQHDVMQNEKTCRTCCSQTRQMISSASWAFPGFTVKKNTALKPTMFSTQIIVSVFSLFLASYFKSSLSSLVAGGKTVMSDIIWPVSSAKWNEFSPRIKDIMDKKCIWIPVRGDKL